MGKDAFWKSACFRQAMSNILWVLFFFKSLLLIFLSCIAHAHFSDQGFIKKFENPAKTGAEIEEIIFSEVQTKDEYISIMFKLYQSSTLIKTENTGLAAYMRYEDSGEIHRYANNRLVEKYKERVEILKIQDQAAAMKLDENHTPTLETIDEVDVEDQTSTYDSEEIRNCTAINELTHDCDESAEILKDRYEPDQTVKDSNNNDHQNLTLNEIRPLAS